MVSDSPTNMIPSRLLLCFRPNAAMDPSSSTSNHAAQAPSSSPSPAYFSPGGGKDGAAVPRILRVFSCRRGKVESTDARGGGGRRRRSATHNLPHIVKAVLFEAPLVKKIRDIKSGKHSRRSNRTLSDKVEPMSNAMDEKPAPTASSGLTGVDPKLGFGSSTGSSTLSRSTATPPRSNSSLCVRRQSNITGQEASARPVGVKRHWDSFSVPCLLPVIILVVICWGKTCAIVCALAWLIAGPLCTRSKLAGDQKKA